MKSWWKSVLRHLSCQNNQPFRRRQLQLELLEDRFLPTTGAFQHVLLLSVDGLREADIADPVLQASSNPNNDKPVLQNIMGLENQGVTYSAASTTSPSDSFPGE